MLDDIFFAFEGASHPEGPYLQLRVLELRAHEQVSALFSYEVDLVSLSDSAEVTVDELVGARATLRMVTHADPPTRVVHGIIADAEQLADVDDGSRYRVVLVPAFYAAKLMKKSRIHLEKTLAEIIDATLQQSAWGAGLSKVEAPEGGDDAGDPSHYEPTAACYQWAVRDWSRLGDRDARPYCVQYEESDFDFVSRLLEEEGISYHIEHTSRETILVLTDCDGGHARRLLDDGQVLGTKVLGYELSELRLGQRFRPTSVSLDDYDYRRPALSLAATSPAGLTPFHTMEQPGRYGYERGLGSKLAEKREGRLRTERRFATAKTRCRALGAGALIRIEHDQDAMSGVYLVVSESITASQRSSFSTRGQSDPFVAELELLRCEEQDSPCFSGFHPARVTPLPRIFGTQTAVVTGEPYATDAEINTGGPEDIGCVRLKFHWDIDVGRHAVEPTSAWVRVSQIFAGSNHGALFHPRVGEEVIVSFLNGDPDRPIIVGRVYNGIKKPHENPTTRPTWSALKSLTLPENGNYNMLGFEDLQGEEQIVLHAARNLDETVLGSHSTGVGGDQSNSVGGNQTLDVKGHQEEGIGAYRDVKIGDSDSLLVGAMMAVHVVGNSSHTAEGDISHTAKNITSTAESIHHTKGGAAEIVAMSGVVLIKNGAGAAIALVGSEIILSGSRITALGGGAMLDLKGDVGLAGNDIVAIGATVKIGGAPITIAGGTVHVSGDAIDLKGGEIQGHAGSIKWNG